MSDYVPNLDAMVSMQFDIPKDTEKWLEWQARCLGWAMQKIDLTKKNLEAELLELAQTGTNVDAAAKRLGNIMSLAMNGLAYISYYQGLQAMDMSLVNITPNLKDDGSKV